MYEAADKDHVARLGTAMLITLMDPRDVLQLHKNFGPEWTFVGI
jgi:hypothetical protein